MTNRRSFLGQAAAAAAVVAPVIAAAQARSGRVADDKPAPQGDAGRSEIVIRMQTSFPEYDIRNIAGKRWAEKIPTLTDGRIRVEYLANGSVAKSGGVVPAIKEGKLDAAFTNSAYLHSVDPTFSLWSSGPAFGMDSNMLLAWHRFGGGKELLEKAYRRAGFDVYSITTLPLPTQPFGWTKKGIFRVEDMKGLKFRTSGLALDVYAELGAQARDAGGDSLAKLLQSGELDAAEFNNLTTDKALNLNKAAQICMVQGYAEATGCMEMVFSRQKWESLSAADRLLLETVCNAVSAEGSWDIADKNSADYAEMAKSGTQFVRTPTPILQAQLNAWDRVLARYAAKNDVFAEVVQSQKRYAERVARWSADIQVNYRPVYDHYFNRKVT